jgi:peptidoglycan/LPS O-acetylase OafA/YrhL
MVMVVGVHTAIFTQPAQSGGANGVVFFLHVSRFLFFFITAFVLFYSYGGRSTSVRAFWRKRFPPIVVPYLAWTLIYWQLNRVFPWSDHPASLMGSLTDLATNLAQGWFHLYFLVVTMQFYLLFPLVSWFVRRTEGRHWQLLGVSALIELIWTGFFQYGWHLMPAVVQLASAKAQVELPSYEFFFVVGALAAIHRHELMGWIRRHRPIAVAGSLAAVVLSGCVYLLNLLLGEAPASADQVFQPATLLLFLGSVLGLWLLADALLRTHATDGWLWRRIHGAADLSFGIYLSHMVALQFVDLARVHGVLGLNDLSGLALGVDCWAMAVLGAVLIAAAVCYSPLSWVLTGRPRRRLSPGWWHRARPIGPAMSDGT